MSLRSISRRDWNAATPKRTPRIIEPRHRKGVVIHWNGPPLRLNPEADPTSLRRREIAVVRAIQRFHQERQNWSDAAYSYLVGQSGAVFEVRGHEWDQFANGADNVGPDDGADRDFYTVMVMIGEGEKPTAAAVAGVKSIVGHVRELGAGDRVLPHNAFKRKTCPGVELTELARSLDRTPLERPQPPADVGLEQWNAAFIGSADAGNYSAAVELWQRGLLAAGFDPGPLDGLVGSKTEGAHRAFAESVGTTVHDRPTDDEWRLLIDNMSGGTVDIRTVSRRARRRSRRASRAGHG